MLTSAHLSSAFANITQSKQQETDNIIAQLARNTVHGTTLTDRLASASTSVYMVSRLFRLVNNTIAHAVNQIILDIRAQGPLGITENPVVTLHRAIKTVPFTTDTFGARIQSVLKSRASTYFPPPLCEEMTRYVWNELKEHIVNQMQLRLECALILSTTFRDALQSTFGLVSEIAKKTINIWVHSVLTTAMEDTSPPPLSHDIVRGDGVAFLFGATYEYNSNETEYNRMSATIGHYIAQHLDAHSDVVRAWQQMWTPASIQAATALESVSADRPDSIALRYTVSYSDRSNIANVFLLSELMYMMYSDYGQQLRSENPQIRLQSVIDLMRTHAFMHTIRLTRDIQEDQESPLYGVAIYPNTIPEQMAEFGAWPTVCARIRKAIRDREQVEGLLGQMRNAIARGGDDHSALPTVTVESGSADTLMAEDWQTGELAVALNGDRRAEFLVRVADYERMLMHGTAENPFDRRDVQTVDVVRIMVE